ncbi:methionyl-tRNA synthetase, partial [Tremellales sp. Uapishka_1]
MRRHLPRLLFCKSCQVQPNVVSVRWSSALPQSPSPIASSSKLPPLFTSDPKPFYVTTPIFYVNASPHIGHLHSLVLTDVLARFSRLRHPERKVIFATGTDEHGLKIQQAAQKLGVEEEKFCEGVSQRFRDLASKAGIGHTDFIRTSEERHYAAVRYFWVSLDRPQRTHIDEEGDMQAELIKSGDIYKSTHSGWYAVSDECFYSASQVMEKDGKMVSLETGAEVVWEEEMNWKFKLGNHRKKLKKWLANVESVHPHAVRHDILRQIPNLEDLSISRPRSRVRWGVPVPDDPEQTIYVWVDALINYLTVLGYPRKTEGWPADIQVVGKDIIRFHAIHWPALLFSAGLEPPKRILAHAHWTMNKSKMSKSKGNVADPIEAMDRWGPDGVRWYLMRVGGSLSTDSDYSERELSFHYKLLASQIGNLASRISSTEILSKVHAYDQVKKDEELDRLLGGIRTGVEEKMEKYEISKVCESLMDVVVAANRHFSAERPWEVQALDSTTAVFYSYEALRIAGILLQPIMPVKSAELLDRLGIPSHERRWEDAEVKVDSCEVLMERLRAGTQGRSAGLFPRVQAAEK